MSRITGFPSWGPRGKKYSTLLKMQSESYLLFFLSPWDFLLPDEAGMVVSINFSCASLPPFLIHDLSMFEEHE